MRNKPLSEVFKYSSPRSILVVTYGDELLELFCPFQVLSNIEHTSIKKGKVYSVTEVKLSIELKIVFVIKGLNFSYSHFDIIV